MPVTTPIDEVDPEDLAPEPGALVVVLVPGAERRGLEDEDQQRQPHGELGEEIVVGDGEGEVQAMDGQRGIHARATLKVAVDW